MEKFVYLESHFIIVDLEGILMIEKTEDKETRTITLIYKDQRRVELDYMNIKDDINSEKTIIQKDFELLIKYLGKNLEEVINEQKDYIMELEKFKAEILNIKCILQMKILKSKKIKMIGDLING